MNELKSEVIYRITRLAGLDCDKDRVRNPCITARESIMLGDYIVALRRDVEELRRAARRVVNDARHYGGTRHHAVRMAVNDLESALAEDTQGGVEDDRT